MSLYNMVHGRNPASAVVLALLDGLNVGRFRDAWVEKNDAGELRLAVYTRNGGGNREHYSDDQAEGPGCDCTGCIITYHLPAHPLYLSDRDDDYDCTYATVYFRMPEDIAERMIKLGAPPEAKLADIAVEAPNMGERWEAAIEAIRTMPLPSEGK